MDRQDLSALKIDRSFRQANGGGTRHRIRLAILIVLAATVVIAILYMARTRTATVETISVSMVYPTQGITTLNASGYVVAQRKAEVAAKVTGRLEWLGVEEGDRVSTGQILARLENRDAAAATEQAIARLSAARSDRLQAQAELTEAVLNYKRQQDLIREGIVARADFDAAEARFKKATAGEASAASAVRVAEAALKGAEASLGYTLISAPFDGVVLTKNADIGDIVTPIGAAASAKASVVSMADMRSLQVEVDVAETNVEKVTKGQPCEIILDALPDTHYPGTVHMVVPTADRSKASVMVKVRFRQLDQRVLPDMSAKVAFLSREPTENELRPSLALPEKAVLSSGSERFVYLYRDGKAHRKRVRTGGKVGDLIELLDGVAVGDKVILSPLEGITDGKRVKPGDQPQ